MWGRDRGMRRGGLAQLLERLHEIDGTRVDSAALPLSGDGRPRADRCDRAIFRKSASIWTCRCSTRIPRCCARCAGPATASATGNHRRLSRARSGHHDALDVHRRVSGRARRSTSPIWKSGSGARELDRVGFFEYSAEEGTPARELPSAGRARERRQRLIALARSAAARIGTRARQARSERRVRGAGRRAARRLRKSDPLRERTGRRRTRGSGARRAKRPALMAASISSMQAAACVRAISSNVTLEGHGPFDFFGRRYAAGGGRSWVNTSRRRRPATRRTCGAGSA